MIYLLCLIKYLAKLFKMRSLSNDLKWRVIYYQLDGFSAKETALRLYISLTTVNKIRKIYRKWDCIIHSFKGYQERRRIFNANDLNVLLIIYLIIINTFK